MNYLFLSFITMLVSVFTFGSYVPSQIQSFFYAVSLTLQSGLICVLPFVIFSLVFSGLQKTRGGAISLLIRIFTYVCIANFVYSWVAYGIGVTMITPERIEMSMQHLSPMWSVRVPMFIRTQLPIIALASGISLGALCGMNGYSSMGRLADFLSRYSIMFLRRVIVPLIPAFVLGFLFMMKYSGMLGLLLKNYIYTAVLSVVLVILIPVIWMIVVVGWKKTKKVMYDLLPAFMTGANTMSSTISMPLLLQAMEENVENKQVARVSIPITISSHILGDGIIIPLLVMVLAKSFGLPMPGLFSYFMLSISMLLLRFSNVAVPGGGIFSMGPYFAACFGLTDEMFSSLITAYILFDPLITVGNIAGNGAMTLTLDRVIGKKNKRLELHKAE